MTGDRDPLWDPSLGDPELARLERALAPLRHRGAPPVWPRRRRPRWPIAAAGGAALAAAAVAALWWRGGALAPGCSDAWQAAAFRFEATAGAPRCAGAARQAGWLPAGAWLETGAADRARLEVADIGEVELGEGSRLALVATGDREHRLALARGALRARVTAPPRLFVIETPAATAIDLGCEYDLEVAADGAGRLRVHGGVVELADAARVVVVPMGSEAIIHAGRGPGTPWATAASAELRAAVARFDAGDAAALDAIVAAAAPTDTVTLWNLLPVVGDAAARAHLHDRLEVLVGLPETVRRDHVLAGDPDALEGLRVHLEGYWYLPELLPPAPPTTWGP
jgi:hypothetical protein